ncbi:uncharacterized protein BJ171DRAFT_568085 [Polychytrium aggregatum]|uniref:uncharacterized protein n=1 Tax=Polychytrium aggregatum TaxID=110093 RepID=UPI0022FF3876|nr:uncharacterized protein BJ171DRAFT_568085 [Polychytrium aggregatum]KAI9204700.1 hypothetical protein BJ171DRAFT_568085 [Polychytrium aggregatum]
MPSNQVASHCPDMDSTPSRASSSGTAADDDQPAHRHTPFFMTGRFADASLFVQSTSTSGSAHAASRGFHVPVHRVLLAAQSPYFDRLFDTPPVATDASPSASSNSSAKPLDSLPESPHGLPTWTLALDDHSGLRHVLEFIYFDKLSFASPLKEAWSVLHLARLFECPPLYESAQDLVHSALNNFARPSAQDLRDALVGALRSEIHKKIIEQILVIMVSLDPPALSARLPFRKYFYLREALRTLEATIEERTRWFVELVAFDKFSEDELEQACDDEYLPRELIANALREYWRKSDSGFRSSRALLHKPPSVPEDSGCDILGDHEWTQWSQPARQGWSSPPNAQPNGLSSSQQPVRPDETLSALPGRLAQPELTTSRDTFVTASEEPARADEDYILPEPKRIVDSVRIVKARKGVLVPSTGRRKGTANRVTWAKSPTRTKRRDVREAFASLEDEQGHSADKQKQKQTFVQGRDSNKELEHRRRDSSDDEHLVPDEHIAHDDDDDDDDDESDHEEHGSGANDDHSLSQHEEHPDDRYGFGSRHARVQSSFNPNGDYQAKQDRMQANDDDAGDDDDDEANSVHIAINSRSSPRVGRGPKASLHLVAAPKDAEQSEEAQEDVIFHVRSKSDPLFRSATGRQAIRQRGRLNNLGEELRETRTTHGAGSDSDDYKVVSIKHRYMGIDDNIHDNDDNDDNGDMQTELYHPSSKLPIRGVDMYLDDTPIKEPLSFVEAQVLRIEGRAIPTRKIPTPELMLNVARRLSIVQQEATDTSETPSFSDAEGTTNSVFAPGYTLVRPGANATSLEKLSASQTATPTSKLGHNYIVGEDGVTVHRVDSVVAKGHVGSKGSKASSQTTRSSLAEQEGSATGSASPGQNTSHTPEKQTYSLLERIQLAMAEDSAGSSGSSAVLQAPSSQAQSHGARVRQNLSGTGSRPSDSSETHPTSTAESENLPSRTRGVETTALGASRFTRYTDTPEGMKSMGPRSAPFLQYSPQGSDTRLGSRGRSDAEVGATVPTTGLPDPNRSLRRPRSGTGSIRPFSIAEDLTDVRLWQNVGSSIATSTVRGAQRLRKGTKRMEKWVKSLIEPDQENDAGR